MEDAELKKVVKQLRKEDKSLNEILDILHKEHDVRITFLELRMLVAEIEKSKPVDKKGAKKKKAKQDESSLLGGTSTEVTVDQIVQPGAQLSGGAKLKSGAQVKWFVDAIGRVNLSLAPGSSQPTQADMEDFQKALSQKLQGGG